jgi:hypothetical protein
VQGPIPPGGGGVIPLIVEAGGGQEPAHLYTCKYLEQKNSIIYKVRGISPPGRFIFSRHNIKKVASG